MNNALKRSAVYLALAVGALAFIASFLPLLHTTVWWVRVTDYPRLQLTIVLAVAGAIAAFGFRRSRPLRLTCIALAVVGIAYNAARFLPFTAVWPAQAAAVRGCRSGDELRVLSANVHDSNRQSQPLMQLIASEDPDVILLMETDDWWHEQLMPLRAKYPFVAYRVEHGPYGMHLFSRYKLLEPKIKFFVAPDNPSIITGVQLPSGTQITFVGLHPRPPARDQSTLFRDAELMHVATMAHNAARPVVMAGDFNSVPWERVVGRLCRIAAFLNPRRGRALVNTYGAQDVALRWPLDYVLFQKEFALEGFERLSKIGSDHFPVQAHLCYAPGANESNRTPNASSADLRYAAATMQAATRLWEHTKPSDVR